MPTYEYRCNACENKWEEFQPITAAAIKKCPACKKNKAERIISAGGGASSSKVQAFIRLTIEATPTKREPRPTSHQATPPSLTRRPQPAARNQNPKEALRPVPISVI